MKADRRPSALARAVPVVVIAVAGLTLGVLLANRDRAPENVTESTAGGAGADADRAVAAAGDGARAVSDAEAGNTAAKGLAANAGATGGDEEAELDALQANLERTLMLPSDYRTVPEFTLTGTDGEPLDQSFLEGRWSLAFFGYTNCPDVCPVTLSVMKDVVAKLEDNGDDPMQVVFVTVDPVRDTAERMREYIGFFDEDFVGVTGELGAVHALTRELGIVASFTADDKIPDAYIVDHTASMLLIDPERRVRAKFSAPHEVGTIVADYRTIRAALN